ncbi:MAG: phosphodiester glycosidase family protein [Anaerolineae bacterium]|nr:phosphodiester glycosidase family protein [Anaerolineae bacterium]
MGNRFVSASRGQYRWLIVLIGLALLVAGCSGTGISTTPIVVFPTRIPDGQLPPTFALGDTPIPAVASSTPPLRLTQILERVASPTPTFRFIVTNPPVRPTAVQPTAIPTLDNNWNPLANGVQWRQLSFRASDGSVIFLVVARIDPKSADIKMKYQPGQAKTIQDWRTALPGTVLIVNANFFDQNNNAIGLVAVDGNLRGRSIPRNDAGMFQVRSGQIKLRSLYLEPYSNTEYFEQAAQGFPVLVAYGQAAPAFDEDVSRVSARRTVFAQDKQGRILVMVTPFSSVKLTDLAAWLAISGLNIDMALNMDGGSSTSMYLATGGPSQYTQGFSPVPVVLAVYPR